MIRKKIHTVFAVLVLALASGLAYAAVNQDKVMSKQSDGTCIVNTTTICNSRGYKGYTPLLVSFKQNQIVKVEALANKETPKYFAMVKKGLFPKFVGMKVAKAAKAKVDGVTGATYSSQSVKDNVKAAAKYYKEHNKK